MKWFTYILKCADASYYTASTNNLGQELNQHQLGNTSAYIRERLPVKLLYFEEFDSFEYAEKRKTQIKGWTRAKKEALIKNQIEELKELAKCLNETSHHNYRKK